MAGMRLPEDAVLRAIGNEIRAWRQTRGLTREQLAKLVEISPTTMGRIERGGPVGVSDTWRIADALGITLTDLVRRAEEAVDLTQKASDAVRARDAEVADEQAQRDPSKRGRKTS